MTFARMHARRRVPTHEGHFESVQLAVENDSSARRPARLQRHAVYAYSQCF